MDEARQVLVQGAVPASLGDTAWGRLELQAVADLDAAAAALQRGHVDALLLQPATEEALEALQQWPALSHAVLDAAVLVLADAVTPARAAALLALGVQDVLPGDARSDLPRALRLAIERKRLDRDARRAHATDLATGLPNHAQLLEHMSHLLALREREPAPMALLVLRIEGLAATAALLGAEAANVLRRKLAVRLRAGLRASDVVAALGPDSFAVLLAWINVAGAVPRVAGKLSESLQRPFQVAGRELRVAVSVGTAHYPEHGREALQLMRHASGEAAALQARGRAGPASPDAFGGRAAANDEDA